MKTETYLILAAVSAGVYLAWKGKEAVAAAASAVNPLNNNNIISQGANAAVGLDNQTASIGTRLFDWLNPKQAAFTPGPSRQMNNSLDPNPVKVTK